MLRAPPLKNAGGEVPKTNFQPALQEHSNIYLQSCLAVTELNR